MWFAFTTSSSAVKGMFLVSWWASFVSVPCSMGLCELHAGVPPHTQHIHSHPHRAVFVGLQGHHSVYYTAWSGPGLYSINAANGHVRWQFPLDNWFRYW